MCGIAGFLGAPCSDRGFTACLSAMSESLRHRGPDDHGQWHDADASIGFAHCRLAVLDLSPAGHQPMHSSSGRYVTVFNGEIYNHHAVRDELERGASTPSWRGHSDTETLLAAVEQWGLEGALARFTGMFAFALWDRRDRRLSLVRDRLGEKPLYYGWVGNGPSRSFVFGSELKALKRHPAFDRPVDRNALALFLRHNCVPAPHTIYAGICKLVPGQVLKLEVGESEPRLSEYWSGASVVRQGLECPFEGSANDAVDRLEALLSKAIGDQMLSDVPLGALLSGGVDSSLVVALMQQQSSRPVKTFTIGFQEQRFDEAAHAREVAQHLRTDHTELFVDASMALDVIPNLSRLYDEPFSDSSQIPSFLVSQLARQHVTVVLSGDGGDELFAGYNRYAFAKKTWPRLQMLPWLARRALSSAIMAVPPDGWDALCQPLQAICPPRFRRARLGDDLHKGASVLRAQSLDELYYFLVSHWRDPGSIVLGATEPSTVLAASAAALTAIGGVERMMALDMLTYLPDDILTKVDRAAMGVSLETRVPFLNHHVVEFAWRLQLDLKIRDGKTKWPLRKLLERHMPMSLVERPKAGFAVPLADWLKGALRDWAEELLAENRLRDEGFFDPAPIRMKWAQHLAGTHNWSYELWDVLMFQAWLEAN